MQNSFPIKKVIVIVIGLLLMTIIGLYYFALSPSTYQALFPACSFKELTGYDCVGCGGQRAVHELLHLNLITAVDYNLLFVVSLPLLFYYIFYAIRRYLFGLASPNNFWYGHTFGLLFIAFVILFFILRNLHIPGLEWLDSSISF